MQFGRSYEKGELCECSVLNINSNELHIIYYTTPHYRRHPVAVSHL